MGMKFDAGPPNPEVVAELHPGERPSEPSASPSTPTRRAPLSPFQGDQSWFTVVNGRYVPLLRDGNTRRSSLWALRETRTEAATQPDGTKKPTTRLFPQPYARRRMRATVSTEARYRALCRRVEARERDGADQACRRVEADRRARSSAAREAVLLRSGDRCENPECLLPTLPYRTRAGAALLEVDHVDSHAEGGRDHPQAMVALCPNCHRNKTHGADGQALTERLRRVAVTAHARWTGNTG
ncbi:HNH endonuclease [Streptomyces lavendulocolor]|uniref:HNH endonuclease n=1 Tax=Streptomyces lavendulocolor TaxID=67316 RepID=UPI003C2C0D86